MKKRCDWAGTDPLMIAYHDQEWGQPLHDDGRLFEFLVLEGAQAGLSWMTILKKRENFRQALDGFDPVRVASYNAEKVNQLLQDKGIIRNRLKIQAAVANAGAFLEIQAAFGSFDTYIWQFVDHAPVRNHWKSMTEIPAKTPASEAMSKDLKNRGFRFVGPTICYALMQAIGMVNDHTIDCYRHAEINDQ
ncbi:MAG: DNA-3-methyladenine glycosylase I [Thermodesulfobacteriota bacterium]